MTSKRPLQPNWIDRLPESARASMEAAMLPHRFRRGSLIFSRTETAQGLYVVREGSALFCLDGESGRRLLFKIIQPNELFGETAVLDARPAPVSVEARSDLAVSLIPAPRVAQLRLKHPAIDHALARVTAANMRALLRLLEETVLMTLRDRMEACLRRLSRESGDGQLDITQAELASMVGASRQAVNGVLGELEDEGLLSRRFRTISCKPLRLQERGG